MANENRQMAATLGQYPAFAGCSGPDIAALVEAGGPFTLPPGWPLVQEGIPSDACYILTEGEVRVFHQRTEVATLGPGDIVGEMTLLGGGQRRATVTSIVRVAGLRIENEALRPLLTSHPALDAAFRAAYEAHSADAAD